MLCPNCGISNDFGREMCKNCGGNLNQDEGSPLFSSQVQDEEKILGAIKNAYGGAIRPNYHSIFFTENFILIAHMGMIGKVNALHFIAPDVNIMKNSHDVSINAQKVNQCKTKGDVEIRFPNVEQLHKYFITQIRINKKLSDTNIEIELIPPQDKKGRLIRNIRSFSYPKKIYKNLDDLLTRFYSDKLHS